MRKSRHISVEGVRKYFQPLASDERALAKRRRGQPTEECSGMVFAPVMVGAGNAPVPTTLTLAPSANVPQPTVPQPAVAVDLPLARGADPAPPQPSVQQPAKPVNSELLAAVVRATYEAMEHRY